MQHSKSICIRVTCPSTVTRMATCAKDRGYGEWREQQWNCDKSFDQEPDRRMDRTEKRAARAPRRGQAAKARVGVFGMRNVQLLEIWSVQSMPEELPDTRHGTNATERGGEGQKPCGESASCKTGGARSGEWRRKSSNI